MKKIVAGLSLVAVFMFGGVAQARDFDGALGVAIANIPPGADIAGMGNAWTAMSDFSSNNPAVVGIVTEDFHAGVAPTYGVVKFGKGPDIQFYSLSGSVKVPVGVLQLTYSNGGSDLESTNDEFMNAKFNSFPTLGVQYGFKVTEGLNAGVGYSHGKSKVLLRAVDPSDATFMMNFLTEGQSDSVSTGLVYQPTKKINVGAMYKKSWDKSEFFIDDSSQGIEKSESDQFRIGTSIKVTEWTRAAVDYQHLNLDGAKFDQVFAGIEQYVIKDVLALYGGWSADGPTAGVGLYLENGGVNVAYMANQAKDLKPFLGEAEIMMVSGYFNF